MRLVHLALFSFLVLSSCSGEPNVVHLKTVKGKSNELANKVDPNKLLTIEIKGMSCEMACGGSIRSSLASTGGVSRVQYDFEDGRDIQTAFISFDDKKISEDEIISIIESINEKQFKTLEHSTQLLGEENDSSEKPSDDASSNVDVSEATYKIPNLFHILTNIIR